jgi:hypothetical protein
LREAWHHRPDHLDLAVGHEDVLAGDKALVFRIVDLDVAEQIGARDSAVSRRLAIAGARSAIAASCAAIIGFKLAS